jgi:hypothetical protein
LDQGTKYWWTNPDMKFFRCALITSFLFLSDFTSANSLLNPTIYSTNFFYRPSHLLTASGPGTFGVEMAINPKSSLGLLFGYSENKTDSTHIGSEFRVGLRPTLHPGGEIFKADSFSFYFAPGVFFVDRVGKEIFEDNPNPLGGITHHKTEIDTELTCGIQFVSDFGFTASVGAGVYTTTMESFFLNQKPMGAKKISEQGALVGPLLDVIIGWAF